MSLVGLCDKNDLYHFSSNSIAFNLISEFPVFMGRITKRFFNGDGQNGESCLFIGSYKRRSERGK